jgi:hypothetical protein
METPIPKRTQNPEARMQNHLYQRFEPWVPASKPPHSLGLFEGLLTVKV